MRARGSVERSTKRTISSSAGEAVTIRCLSSPRRAGTSYGVSRASVAKSASAGSASWSAGTWSPHSRRSVPPPVGSRIPRVGASTVPATTILALLRNPASALGTGGSQSTSGHGASSAAVCSCFARSWSAYGVGSHEQDRHTPASK